MTCFIRDEPQTIGSGEHADDEEGDNARDFKDLADVQEQDREEEDSCEGKHEVHYITPLPARCGNRYDSNQVFPKVVILRVIVMIFLFLLYYRYS